jgi:tetratricopeptide (TPR) repeat protein
MRQRTSRALRVLGSLLLAGAGLAVASAYAWSRHAQQAAQQALGRHDLEEAQGRLAQSLRLWPWNARAQLLAAQTARRRDAHAEAERLLTAYERQQGVTAASELEWLLLGVQQGECAVQEDALKDRVDREDPAAPLILEALAKGYLRTYRWSSMMGCLDQLLQQQPGHVPALILRARGWEGLRRLERAREDYHRALELAPDAAAARLGLADILSRLGHVQEARDHYEFVRQRQPHDPAVLLGLARCRFDCSELAETEQLLDTLLTAQPDNVAGLVDRARLALRRGHMTEAEQNLSRAVALADWHREAHQLLLFCLEASGKREAAQACQERLRELEARDGQMGKLGLRFRSAPRDPSVRQAVGQWCLQNGQEEAGLRWLFTSLDLDPRHAPSHAILADYFDRTGQPRRAAQHRHQAEGRETRQAEVRR